MLQPPHDGDTHVITNLGATGGSTNMGTSVTTGGSTTTKGTAVECISAANNVMDSWGIMVYITGSASPATASEACVDILAGAATEDVLIPNLLGGYADIIQANGLKKWFFPLFIPAGTRIAAQAAGTRTSTALVVGIKLYGGSTPPWRVGRKVTTYGIGTVPNGTVVVSGASGAQGSYTQITASTSEDHYCIVPSLQINSDTTCNGRQMHMGIGIGAATEELLSEWDFDTSANETVAGPADTMPIFRDIPSGTRLTARLSNSGTNDNGYQVALHAVS